MDFNKIDRHRLINGILHKVNYYKAKNTGGICSSHDSKFNVLNKPNQIFPYYSINYKTKKYGNVLIHLDEYKNLVYIKCLDDDLVFGSLLRQHENHTIYWGC